MKLPKSILFFFLFLSAVGFSQETFKVMFYNLLNFPLQEPQSRIQYLDLILNDYKPDIFMVCELNNVEGALGILNVLQTINADYAMANFVLNTSDDAIGNQNDLQNLLYYDSSKFILEAQDQITTLYRDFNHYTIKLNTIEQNTDPIFLEAFVCHLKASDGEENENLRLQMVNDLESYLNNPVNNFNSSSFIMLAGDFNVYSSDEPAFQELIDNTNTITFVDPANRIGNWHTNISYLDVFSQSTRTSSSLGGSTGGFDDRFDFIMTSEYMFSNSELFYVSSSYQVYGNNNNPSCFNQEINSTSCSGSLFSIDIRDALYNFSDHLPVTLEIQTNQSLSVDDFSTQNLITFIDGNFISSYLKLKVKFGLIPFKYLNIYNTLGQKVRTVAIDNSGFITEDISHFSNGLYFIIPDSYESVKPLKFFKTN